MKEHSARYSEVHFDAKAARYQAALAAFPQARTLELVPFLLLLDSLVGARSSLLTVADMLCGSGLLTRSIYGLFRNIHGVDVSTQMLEYFPKGPGLAAVRSPVEEHTDLLATTVHADVVVSLAGLHHVYERDGHLIDRPSSNCLQQSVVSGWGKSLPPGGVMIMADVTSPTPSMYVDQNRVSFGGCRLALWERARDLLSELCATVPDCQPLMHLAGCESSLYRDGILLLVPDCMKAEPSLWFREIVANEGLYGHEDHFLDPGVILASLRTVEGITADYIEIPTPWIFPCREVFEYFFYEKFVLGPPISSPSIMKPFVREMIWQEASRCLGIHVLPDGAVAVGWRLGFYVAQKASC